MSETTDVTASGDAEAADRVEGSDILDAQIREGLSELRRPTGGLSLSALSAGLDIGFGPLLMVVLLTTAGAGFAETVPGQLLLGVVYGVGFILVVLGQSELFTEHTTLAVLPVLDGQATVGKLARLWGLVYAGNVVGAAVFSVVVVAVGPAIDVVDPEAFVTLAEGFTGHDWLAIAGAGVLAGWLMGLLSWLVAAADSTVGRLAVVWIITSAIGFAHLPHSIAGVVEVLPGVLVSAELTLLDFGRFLSAATVGNAIGGSVFVALLKYGHVVRSGPSAASVGAD